MRRWIVPNLQKKGSYKLVVSYSRPVDAVCEAPDAFHEGMNDYFVVKEGRNNLNQLIFSVSLHPDWDKKFNAQEAATAAEERAKNDRLHGVILKQKEIEAFNNLPAHKRFIRSIFKERKKK